MNSVRAEWALSCLLFILYVTKLQIQEWNMIKKSKRFRSDYEDSGEWRQQATMRWGARWASSLRTTDDVWRSTHPPSHVPLKAT